MELEYSFGQWSIKGKSDESDGRNSLKASIRESAHGWGVHMWANIGTPNMARNIQVHLNSGDFSTIAKLMIQADRGATLKAFAEAILAFPDAKAL
ncbi:hypothetical protein QO004_000471 [Rhizobium mesoamericanum]|uniref:hypothetical protein n=1 Tax=Rhizobium mesoamericanum TaxID=1079800 RepID=UPI0027834986|nr:hypothetical protein [Rhizobium mesoamericanum]MDQ0558696.1 hypothetical protein [Rhizobium mesoamericanum]